MSAEAGSCILHEPALHGLACTGPDSVFRNSFTKFPLGLAVPGL